MRPYAGKKGIDALNAIDLHVLLQAPKVRRGVADAVVRLRPFESWLDVFKIKNLGHKSLKALQEAVGAPTSSIAVVPVGVPHDFAREAAIRDAAPELLRLLREARRVMWMEDFEFDLEGPALDKRIRALLKRIDP